MTVEDQVRLLPERPGCYIFRDAAGRILYVGKAVNLRQRVRQYFQSSRHLPPKVQLMVPQIARIEHIVTDNEVEALILESNLIKRHKPKFNIRLRDDKHYPYIRLTLGERWPRLLIARQMRKDGSRYFGPYTDATAARSTLKLMQRIFPLRTCNDPSRHPRGCLMWHIGRCLAPCLPDFDRHEAYAQAVKEAEAFLEGRVEATLKSLRARMEEAAENLEFERAAELRDQIRAVEKVAERQKIISDDMQDRDVVAWAREGDEACVQVFFVRQGKLVGRDSFVLSGAAGMEPGEILGAFLQQHYGRTDFIPPEILVSDPPADADLLARWLSERRGGKVALVAPKRGEKRRLVDLVAENAREAMAERRQARERELAATEGAMAELQAALGLDRLPYRIECFDIAHVQGTDVVAAMAVFEGGEPKKSDYRKFKMRVDRNDDFASMREAVYRRFRRGLLEREALAGAEGTAAAPAGRGADGGGTAAAEGALAGAALAAEAPAAYGGGVGAEAGGPAPAAEGGLGLGPAPPGAAGTAGAEGTAAPKAVGRGRRAAEEPKFAIFPDLLIIDGGKGQLGAALDALRELGLEGAFPVFALAKEEEVLYAPGRPDPIALPRDSQALFLLQRIRDETHRFGNAYHQHLRSRRLRRSVLDDAPGIGPRRKQALLQHFGSVRRLMQATVDEIAAVPGMNRAAAERLVEYLEQQED